VKAGPSRLRRDFLRMVSLVARRDYVRTVRRRGFVAGTLLLPLAIGLALGISSLAAQGSIGAGPTGPILVVNESSVPMTSDAALTPHVVIADRAQAEAQLAAETASEYYLFSAEWPTDPTIQAVVPDTTVGTGSPIEVISRQQTAQTEVELLARVSLLRADGVPDETLVQLMTPNEFETVTTAGDAVDEADVAASFLLPYAFTLIFMLSIFITSGYLLQSVTEEKENRVVEILLSSIPALPLMAGKVVGLGAAGLTQVAIWLLTALIALPLANSQFSLSLSLPWPMVVLAFVFFTLGYLSYGAIFAAIGALAPSSREGQQYGSFFGFLAVIPLIFSSVFLTDLNSPIVTILCLLPLTAPAAMLEVLALSASPPWGLVLASLVSQSIFVIIAVVASGRIFRATLLLYGTRPSIKRIADAVFARS
jgi:ABC-2 type transport system permease protein